MSWWQSQPVYPMFDTREWSPIGNIPKYIPDLNYTIYTFNIKYIDELLTFINNNYITGYKITKNYLYRKIALNNSISLVLMEKNVIVGFIYSCPIVINNYECGYVDLMTVANNKRKNGLAKILISAITNYSNKKHYIHKKDNNPLPFPFFYQTKHYTANINLNYKTHKYNLIETNNSNITKVYNIYKIWLKSQVIKTIVDLDTFMSSESVKTYFIYDFIVSVAIFEFTYGFIRNTKIAELFFINYNIFNYELYQSLLYKLKILDVHFLVVQDNSFFRDIIKIDNFFESMDLFLHSYNLFIPNRFNNIQIPVF